MNWTNLTLYLIKNIRFWRQKRRAEALWMCIGLYFYFFILQDTDASLSCKIALSAQQAWRAPVSVYISLFSSFLLWWSNWALCLLLSENIQLVCRTFLKFPEHFLTILQRFLLKFVPPPVFTPRPDGRPDCAVPIRALLPHVHSHSLPSPPPS